MGTVPFPKDEEPTQADKVESVAREIIAGHPQGSVRRIALYVVAFIAFALAAYTPLGTLAFIVGAAAVILLSSTDQLA